MVLETERLILRPFRESDAEDVLEYLKEPAVNCFAEMKLNSLEEAKAEMKKRVGETEYYFAIVLKDSAKVIGEIDAFPERGEPHDTSSPLDTFSPCWMLNHAYQGKGYAYEAAHAFFVYRKPLAGRVVQKRLMPMRKNKTPSVIVEMRSGNCKLQNKGRSLKNE